MADVAGDNFIDLVEGSASEKDSASKAPFDKVSVHDSAEELDADGDDVLDETLASDHVPAIRDVPNA